MKKLFLIFLVCFPVTVFAQQKTGVHQIDFQIEELSKPEKLLDVISSDAIYEKLIVSDAESLQQGGDKPINPSLNLIAKSEISNDLVNFGYHSFFYGIYQAYADHRPFVLSPDMIWLLISQGFAQHVNANAEQLRRKFVRFDGKVSLIVDASDIVKDHACSPACQWEKIFPQFTEQIGKHTGKELIDVLSCDFSTTTAVEKVAAEITVMNAMKPYFEYVVMIAVCGIPEITLQGTTEDWEKILAKTKKLRQYDLEWWTAEIEPLLEGFIKASKGEIDKDFWRNMFKYHTKKAYGNPKIIDGWIVKFFPYDKDGKKNNLKTLSDGESLPDEIVKVDLIFREIYDNGDFTDTPLELWAGFIGLEQNEKTFALTPKIAWMIRKKDVDEFGYDRDIKQSLEAANKSEFGIEIRVNDFPKELLSFKAINNLRIEFIDKIVIPDEFKNVQIKRLGLKGKIEMPEIERLKNMFPNTDIQINGEIQIKNGEIKNLSEEIKKLNK